MFKKDKKTLNEIGDTVENIEINIYTNIPGKETTPIPFTKNLYHNKFISSGIKLQDNPFFTPDYKINTNVINFDFNKKINHLFNKNEFVNIIDKDKSFKTLPNSAEVNIQTLLMTLFPTYYPVLFNQTDTFTELIEEKLPNTKYASSFFAYFKKVFKTNKSMPNKTNTEFADVDTKEVDSDDNSFCYLDIDGTTYTVLKVVHLNDFINNPKYYEIYKKFLDILKWKKNQKSSNEIKIYKYKRDIIDLMDKLKYNMNLLNTRYSFFTNLRIKEMERNKNDSNTILIKNIKKETNKIFYTPYDTDKYFINTIEGIDYDPSHNNYLSMNDVIDVIKNSKFKLDPPISEDDSILKKVKDEIINDINKLQKYEVLDDTILAKIESNLSTTPLKDILTQNGSNTLFQYTGLNGVLVKYDPSRNLIQDPSKNEIVDNILKNLKILKEIKNNSFKQTYDTSFTEMIRINRELERFKDLKPEDQTIYENYKEVIDKQYDEYANYIDFINPLFKNSSVAFDSKFVKSYEDIFNIYKKLTLEIKVQEVYFDEKTNITKEIEEEVTKYFNTKHTKYSEFLEFIKKFVQPNREASNEIIVKLLLDHILGEYDTKSNENNVVGNRNDTLKNFLKSIKHEKIDEIKESLRLSYEKHHTRVVNAPMYEIQVYMDLIKGKLTKDDIKKWGCYFKDKELVSTYNNVVHNNVFDNIFIFDDKLPVISIPDVKKLKPKTLDEKGVKPQPTTTTTNGGNKKKMIKTRRRNKYNYRKSKKCKRG